VTAVSYLCEKSVGRCKVWSGAEGSDFVDWFALKKILDRLVGLALVLVFKLHHVWGES